MKVFFLFILFLSLQLKSFSQGLIINNTPSFVLTANSNLVLSETAGIYNIGSRTFNSNSNVRFISSGTTNQFIGGTGEITFGNIFINKVGGGVYLINNTNIANTLNLSSGHFDLKNFTCNLLTTGQVVGENENSRIRATGAAFNDGGGTGTIITTRNNPSGNVAGLGLNFTPSAALGNNTIIRRGCNALQGTGSYTGNYSIFRWYRIEPGTGTYTSITVNNFYYWGGVANAELNGHPEANLQMFQRVQYWNGTTNPIYWEPRTTSPIPASDYVSSSTTSNPMMINYILITLGSTTYPLPVEFLTFLGYCKENKNIIYWQTASETNNYGFEIQKSSDAQEWENIGFVYGQGNNNSDVSYQYEDINPYIPTSYYRLKQIDNDGNSTFSQIIQSTCYTENYNEDFIPYISNGQLTLNIQGIPNNSYKFVLTNAIGQTLYSSKITLSYKNEQVFVNIPLAKGIYYTTLISDKNITSKPFIIK